MDKPSRRTTYGLPSDQLSRLLELAAEPAASDEPEPAAPGPAAAEALRRLLDQPLPRGGPAPGELLASPRASLADLRSAKDHGKHHSLHETEEAQVAAGTALYYAAIATARLFHGQLISAQPPEKLADAFARLARQDWMPADLRDLFHKAGLLLRPPQ